MGNKKGGGPGRTKVDPVLEEAFHEVFSEQSDSDALGSGSGPFGSTLSHDDVYVGSSQGSGSAEELATTLAGDQHKYELASGGWVAYYGRSSVTFRPTTKSDPSNPGITVNLHSSKNGSSTLYRIHIKETQ